MVELQVKTEGNVWKNEEPEPHNNLVSIDWRKLTGDEV